MRVLLLLLLAVGLTGCHKPDTFRTGDGTFSPITPADISYRELAEQYNQTVEPFSHLWSRTNIDIEWYEVRDDGDRVYRQETGEGKFMYRRPGDTALLVDKLGKTYLWAGSNDTQYWLFDMVDGEKKTAYVGAFSKLREPGRSAFPLPVRPDAVPVLLGLLPLPPADSFATAPPVDLYKEQYLVELAGLRMLIDPKTYRPTRIDLTNDAGFSVLTSKLEGRFPVDVAGVPDHQLPVIARRAEVYVAGYESRLTVEMVTATTNPAQLIDLRFDYEALRKAMKIDHVVPLDR